MRQHFDWIQILIVLLMAYSSGFPQNQPATLRQQHEQEIQQLKNASEIKDQRIRQMEAQLAARSAVAGNTQECETLLHKATTQIADLEKRLSVTQAQLDSSNRASEVVLRIEQEKCNVRLDALNDKLVLQQTYSDSILALENKKYEEVKKILFDAARRRWYESPQLLLGVGVVAGFLLGK
jgi:DNA repair exonuclease SbcCD ATPase subunit